MIFFDVTKTGVAGHRSGLTRVSQRLRDELRSDAAEVRWPDWNGEAEAEDWFVTSEIFTPDERPGFDALLHQRRCRFAAIFHDAIPLKHPHITWPQSVARHPGYLKMLARFDRVLAVSEASRRELEDFWRWQGIERPPLVETLPLGADFNGAPRVVERTTSSGAKRVPSLLCLGIVEPRKNQMFLLEVAEALWRAGLDFELHVVGRVNPHFGQPIVERMRLLRREFYGLHFHAAASDAQVTKIYGNASAAVFPTIAEGCGLPLLEALWMGVPCVCSDLPVLRENANGGCVPVPANDRAAWMTALRRVLTDEPWHAQLAREASRRMLPRWANTADMLRTRLAGV